MAASLSPSGRHLSLLWANGTEGAALYDIDQARTVGGLNEFATRSLWSTDGSWVARDGDVVDIRSGETIASLSRPRVDMVVDGTSGYFVSDRSIVVFDAAAPAEAETLVTMDEKPVLVGVTARNLSVRGGGVVYRADRRTGAIAPMYRSSRFTDTPFLLYVAPE